MNDDEIADELLHQALMNVDPDTRRIVLHMQQIQREIGSASIRLSIMHQWILRMIVVLAALAVWNLIAWGAMYLL